MKSEKMIICAGAIFLWVGFSGCSGKPWVRTPAAESGALPSAQLIDRMARAFEPSVLTYSRSIVLFHWVPAGNFSRQAGFSLSADAAAKNYLKKQTAEFTGKGEGAMGPGLYASTDPVATFSYGADSRGSKKDAGVLWIPIPKGTRFIDWDLAVHPLNSHLRGLSAEMVDELNQLGCDVEGFSLSIPCRKVYAAVFARM
jgi:hypothetical protein